MASIGKCVGIMAGVAGFAGGAATSYLLQMPGNKAAIKSAEAQAKNGKIKIGGRTPDGKLWDGEISVDEFKKNIQKKAAISAGITGLLAAAGTAIISALTLLLKAKLK